MTQSWTWWPSGGGVDLPLDENAAGAAVRDDLALDAVVVVDGEETWLVWKIAGTGQVIAAVQAADA